MDDDVLPSRPALPRQMRFGPKRPPNKSRSVVVEREKCGGNDTESADALALLRRLNEKREARRVEKVEPVQVAFEGGSHCTPRYRNKPSSSSSKPHNSTFHSSPDPIFQKKQYKEPWDYTHSYYPVTLPLRSPYSGNPEVLDEAEFGNTCACDYDDRTVNPAVELGLVNEDEGMKMMFLQLPTNLPTGNQHKLEEMPKGHMGKLVVYKSGAVKLKIGDVLFDVSPGSNCSFAQDVVAINTKDGDFCVVGEVSNKAVVTPDMSFLLDNVIDLV